MRTKVAELLAARQFCLSDNGPTGWAGPAADFIPFRLTPENSVVPTQPAAAKKPRKGNRGGELFSAPDWAEHTDIPWNSFLSINSTDSQPTLESVPEKRLKVLCQVVEDDPAIQFDDVENRLWRIYS